MRVLFLAEIVFWITCEITIGHCISPMDFYSDKSFSGLSNFDDLNLPPWSQNYTIAEDCNFYGSGRKQVICKVLQKSRKFRLRNISPKRNENMNSVKYFIPLITDLDTSENNDHYNSYEVDSYDYINPSYINMLTSKPGLQRKDFLWRKRLKELDFIIMFLIVTGIPLLWTLAVFLLLTENNSRRIRPDNNARNPLYWGLQGSSTSGEMSPFPMPKLPNPEEEEGDTPEVDKAENIRKATARIALTKEVLRVASQSFNLASNTVDLFNTLRGVDIGGIGDGDGETDRNRTAIATERSMNMNVRFVSRLLEISSTCILFIIQIINY